MKVTVLQKDLAKVLTITSRFVSNRAQLPVLSNIVLSAHGNKLTIKATNLEISICASLGSSIDEEGEIAVPARVLAELVTSLRAEKIMLATDNETLKLESEGFKGSVSGLNTSDFPVLPCKIEGGVFLDSQSFSDALGKVLFSSSPDDSRPALSGVLVSSSGSTLSFVSSDGFRLSKKDVPLKENMDIKIILPKNILVELVKICNEAKKINIKIEENDKQILFGVGDMVLSSRLVEGEYPPFEKIIPQSASIVVNLGKDEFRDAVKTAGVFARDGGNIVKLKLEENQVVVSAESARSGREEAEIPAKITGPEISILYNYRYIEEFLGVVKGEGIIMKFNSPDTSGVFLDSSDENYLHLIMPVKS